MANIQSIITNGNGNVLIGTTVDSGYKLFVNGSIVNNTNINSTGDAGLLITSGLRLGFDQSGVRSWNVKATGGNLAFNSGDGNGAFTFGASLTATSLLSNTWVGAQGLRYTSAPAIQGVYLGNSGTTSSDFATIEMVGGTGGGSEIDFTIPSTDFIGRIGYYNPTNYMWFVTNSAEQMRITSGGNLLIGTTTDAGYKLAVAGNVVLGYAQNRPVFYDSNGGNFQIKANAGGWATGYFFQGSSGTFLGGWGGYGGNNALGYLWAGDDYNTPTMVVYGAQGNVGIGTTEPSNKLTVTRSAATQGTESTYGFRVVQGKPITIGGDDTYAYIQSWSSGPLSINAQGNNVLFPNANSNVIIGTTTDTGGVKLQVAPSAGTWVSGTFSGNGGTDKFVVGNYNGRVSIGGHNSALNAWAAMSLNFDGGNIQIGTLTDNGRKLNVNGDIFASGEFYSNQYASARYIRYNWNSTNFSVGAGTGIRWVIGRIYWNQIHWGTYSGMDIEIVWNYYNGARKKYTISNGAGGGGIYLRQSQSYGSAYARVSLGSAVDTGTTSGGYSNYYQDVYLDVTEYNQVSINGELKGPQISIDKTSIGGGEYGWATFFSSPTSSNISTFTNTAATILTSENNWGYIDNRLGINVANPDYQLDVFSATTPVIRVVSNNASGVGNPRLLMSRGGEDTFQINVEPNVGVNFKTVVANAGYMDFYTGTDVVTMRLSSSKNVLIGTTTDSGYKLRVNGSSLFDAPILCYTGNGYITAITGDGVGSNNGFGYSFLINTYSHEIGRITGQYEDSASGGTGGIAIYTRQAGTLNQRLVVNGAGTVQVNNNASSGVVGTNFIAYAVDSDSYFRLGNNTSNSLDIQLTRSDTATMFSVNGHSGLAYFAGNVLIGTTTDGGYKLRVNGEILADDDIRILNTFALVLNGTDNNWRIGRNTITDSGWLTSNTLQVVVFGSSSGQGFQVVNSNGTALFEIDGVAGASRFTNALGVGVNPSGTAGRIDASNDIVAYSSSDLRLKENIKPIENALDKVKALTGVEFDWKAEHKEAHGYEGHDTGVIAQEVQGVMPSAVRTNDTGYLAVRYEKLIGLLIEANKELANRVEYLESKLK